MMPSEFGCYRRSGDAAGQSQGVCDRRTMNNPETQSSRVRIRYDGVGISISLVAVPTQATQSGEIL